MCSVVLVRRLSLARLWSDCAFTGWRVSIFWNVRYGDSRVIVQSVGIKIYAYVNSTIIFGRICIWLSVATNQCIQRVDRFSRYNGRASLFCYAPGLFLL